MPKLPKKSAEVSLNLSPKQLFYCRCRIICVASIFFPTNRDESENLLQSLGAMRDLRVRAR